jgi:hypothetical protein
VNRLGDTRNGKGDRRPELYGKGAQNREGDGGGAGYDQQQSQKNEPSAMLYNLVTRGRCDCHGLPPLQLHARGGLERHRAAHLQTTTRLPNPIAAGAQ